MTFGKVILYLIFLYAGMKNKIIVPWVPKPAESAPEVV